jgi:hypothetical protein
VQSPVRWSEDADWKLDYCNIERMTPEEIRAARAEFDAVKAPRRSVRPAPSSMRSRRRGEG